MKDVLDYTLREAIEILNNLNKNRKVSHNEDYRLIDYDSDCISVRVTNALKKAGIKYVEQLVRIGERNILKYREIGRKSIKVIKRVLREEYGVELPYGEYMDSHTQDAIVKSYLYDNE